MKSWRETDGCSFFITSRYSMWEMTFIALWASDIVLVIMISSDTLEDEGDTWSISIHTIFCSELWACEHQVQGEESDEIPPRVIISCKRSFIIEWQLRYCIRVVRGRWEFENWDWLKSGHQPPSPTQNTNSLNVILAFTNLSTFWSRILWESAEAENQSRKILCIDIICIRPA